jgi:hypothetical protein
MTSHQLTAECEIIALAKAIRGANTPDEAIEKARAAGFTDAAIERDLEEAMERDFERRLQFARAT